MPQPAKDDLMDRFEKETGLQFTKRTPELNVAVEQFIRSLLDAERKRLREALEAVPLIADREGAHNCIVRTEALAAFDRVAGEV